MELRRDIFQAIADPTRREIIEMIAWKPQNVTSIADEFDMSRQAISLHVKILTECGVVVIHKEGRQRFCHIQPEKLEEIDDWLEPFRKLWQSRFNRLDNILSDMKKNKDEH